MDRYRASWALPLLLGLLCCGPLGANEAGGSPRQRVLTGFDGLRFGASQADVRQDLGKRDAMQFESARMVNGEEIRYRTLIGDLPFDVFLSFEPKDGWRRALVQDLGATMQISDAQDGVLVFGVELPEAR